MTCKRCNIEMKPGLLLSYLSKDYKRGECINTEGKRFTIGMKCPACGYSVDTRFAKET